MKQHVSYWYVYLSPRLSCQSGLERVPWLTKEDIQLFTTLRSTPRLSPACNPTDGPTA